MGMKWQMPLYILVLSVCLEPMICIGLEKVSRLTLRSLQGGQYNKLTETSSRDKGDFTLPRFI
jgi:hypothetical protein